MASSNFTHKKRPTRHPRKGSRNSFRKGSRNNHSTKRRMRKSAPQQSIFSNLFKGGDASTHAINVYGGTDTQHAGANGSIAQIQSSYMPQAQSGGNSTLEPVKTSYMPTPQLGGKRRRRNQSRRM